jgi:hypothetical protein
MKPAMAALRQLGFLAVRQSLRMIGIRPPRVLFIMGHMRSGSTLLMHLLVTHPEIIGCGERSVAYRSDDDLDKLELAARRSQHGLFRQVSYVVDQLNHDQFSPERDLLRSERVRCIFLIREPEETIRSLLHLTRASHDPWTVERAVEYYAARLKSLSACRQNLKSRSIALTYSDLVDSASAALPRLTSFLALASELQQEYAIQPFTGRRGDPSERIRLGRIQRGTLQTSFQLSKFQRQRALEAYRSCLASLG